MTSDPVLNPGGRRAATAADIDAACAALWRAWGAVLAGAAVLALL